VAVLYVLQQFGIVYGSLVYFVVTWYTSSRCGMVYLGKSGNLVYVVLFGSLSDFRLRRELEDWV
jgi:hypothetical protein